MAKCIDLSNWYCADFETTTSKQSLNTTRVWAWSQVSISDPDNTFIWGTTLDSFLEQAFYKGGIYFFRNVKFDGEFIMYYLFTHGFTYSEEKKLLKNEFSALISDMGKVYNIKVNNGKSEIEFRDSLKIINLSIKETAKSFGLKETKLKIDYDKIREIDYKLDNNEIEYIKNDVTIDAKSLIYFFDKGLYKLTIGSDALFDFKQTVGDKKLFLRYYPLIPKEIFDYLRKAYKGGYSIVSENCIGKLLKEGNVFDVNSLYPSRAKFCKLPYGEPKFFKGKYVVNNLYDLYVSHIRCMFHVKHNKLPTIQIKGDLRFNSNEYLYSSNNEIVDLYLTNIDLDLFLEHYEVDCLEYIDGYMFRSMIHPKLVEYVDKWYAVKEKAGKDKNKGLKQLAKSMLNNLTGKFGQKMVIKGKIPWYDKDKDLIRYKYSKEKIRDGVYIPVVMFITAWGRDMTIRTSQKVRDYSLKNYNEDKYYYSDTDSIHTGLTIEEFKQFAQVDPDELGAWACEKSFIHGKFLRSKCYIETNEDGKIEPKIAGLPESMHDMVNYDNFKFGTEYERKEGDLDENGEQKPSKMRFKRVSGGVLLLNTKFKIKNVKIY